MYLGGVNRGILMDHFMSLRHGLEFLLEFLEYSESNYLIKRIHNLVAYVKQKLQSVPYYGKDESLVINLDHEYSDLREKVKNVIIKPGTNEYEEIFPKIFTRQYHFKSTILLICEKIKELVTSDCKADHITPMVKELEDIRKMLKTLLEPIFEYAKFDDWPSKTVKEEVKEIFDRITAVIDRAACFIFFTVVGKMDDRMVIYLKNRLSDLIIEEAQIMKMYLILDTYSFETLESHISMSLRLLKWNKKCYMGAEMGATLDDHFMSIKHGLKFLVEVLKVSFNKDLEQRVQCLVAIVKRELYSLHNNQIVNMEHAYGNLREEMQNVVINQGAKKLFSENLEEADFWITFNFNRTKYLLVETIMKFVTSSCKADKNPPMRRELEELSNKVISLGPLFYYLNNIYRSSPTADEEKVSAALTTFLARATYLIYLSIGGKLNGDMLISLRCNLCLLIEETEIKEMSLVLGIIYFVDLEADIDKSLSLLKRQEEFHIGTTNEAVVKDNIVSLKHGMEFLKWLPKVYTDIDLERRIILLAQNVKQKLELLTYKQGDESLNMDVNGAYNDLIEEMKIAIIDQATDTNDILFPDLNMVSDFRGYSDFLVEKITTLVTSNCKSYQVAPLKKEQPGLGKMLTSLKPLCLYVNISTTMKETDVGAMYTIILNEILHVTDYIEEELRSDYIMEHKFDNDYIERELYLLGNLILLLKSNVQFLNDANSKLYEVLIDIHTFLLGLSPNVLLRKLHLLQASFQDILGHSIPIFCSCYLEQTEVDISAELNRVADLIKQIKSEAQEIKLYYFPRADDLGFLECFSGYLEDLKKNQEISIKEEIVTLNSEVSSMLSLAMVRNQEELGGTPWIDIINMAYQAEYIIDLYLASSCTDFELISSLSKVIKQLKNIRTDLQGLSCQNLPRQDVDGTSKLQVLGTATHLSDNDAIVGLHEETSNIMEHLLKGENKVDVISITGMAGIGKTTLALSLFKTPLVANHFDILAWCTVSQSYEKGAMLISILDQINAPDKSHRSLSDDEALADRVCKRLKKRRYLIVLDDIWEIKLWDYLKLYLPDDLTGSRVVITTRNRDVVDQIGSKVNELHGLSKEKSWDYSRKRWLKK